jgi:hypothetical protein
MPLQIPVTRAQYRYKGIEQEGEDGTEGHLTAFGSRERRRQRSRRIFVSTQSRAWPRTPRFLSGGDVEAVQVDEAVAAVVREREESAAGRIQPNAVKIALVHFDVVVADDASLLTLAQNSDSRSGVITRHRPVVQRAPR